MKRGRILLVLVLLVAFIQAVSAIDTKITVNTLPEHDIMVGVLKTGEIYYLLDSFHKNSGSSGVVTVTYSSSLDVIDVGVWVKKDNQLIIKERFESKYTGSPIEVEVYPEGYARPEPENDTIENETIVNETEVDEVVPEQAGEDVVEEVIEEQSDAAPGITGAVASDGEGFLSKNMIYIVVVLAVLIIVVFMGTIAFKRKKGPEAQEIKEIKVKKLSEVKIEKKEKIEDYKKSIEDAEKKIEEAQKEIKKVKNAERIEEIRKKIQEDQKELEKLEKGED